MPIKEPSTGCCAISRQQRTGEEGTCMADQKHIDRLRRGVKVWNAWRQKYPDLRPDLSGANLLGVRLIGANLSGANFAGADLSGADFYTHAGELSNQPKALASYLAYFSETEGLMSVTANKGESESTVFITYRANLSGTSFAKAKLNYTNLTMANLSKADLRGADLTGADLTRANLRGTDLSRAVVSGTKFNALDLRFTKGLETIKHNGPSTIGVDTILRSKGSISETFLRGIGVPEIFIEYARALNQNPIQYYTCFISYSSKDQKFTERLHADLQSHGVRCWFAPEDLKIGDKLRPLIDESIYVYDRLLLVLSAHSVASQWVEQEVETALERERKEKRAVLFPIRLDNSVMEMVGGWPAFIRNTRHIGDFTLWKQHNDYQMAFDRLLRDLEANTR
jgi:uncharacterized protein YjbI with pentapeptide repeats